MIEESYEVHTHWGWFCLDEGAYRDYLQNKLWITWRPRSMSLPAKGQEPASEQALPPSVSEEAVRLRDEAAKQDAFLFAKARFPGASVPIPFKPRMKQISIHELPLSVRASNCLMRSGASAFGALYEIISSEAGLRSIRNLGMKSEEEIYHYFFVACYYLLTPGEKAQYWQRIVDDKKAPPPIVE